MSNHRSNNDNPLTPESLIEILKEYKNKRSAIINVHRQSSPNIYGRMLETGILTIDVTKHLISKTPTPSESVRSKKPFSQRSKVASMTSSERRREAALAKIRR